MKKWIIANFKMYKNIDEAVAYAKEFKDKVEFSKNNIAVCPTYVCLNAMAESFAGSNIIVGAQNCADHEEGAFTGEVSASMIKSTGARLVIVGHSERRRYYGETDQLVNVKLKQALKEGLTVVACLADDGGLGLEKNIREQVKTLLKDIEPTAKVIIAFEPVWAIGTGVAMQTSDIEKVIKCIKQEARKVLGVIPQVLYGGSVNVSNAKEILALESVDGLLIGGASKDPNVFAQICNM